MSVKAWPCQHLVLFFRYYKISQNEEQNKGKILANQTALFGKIVEENIRIN